MPNVPPPPPPPPGAPPQVTCVPQNKSSNQDRSKLLTGIQHGVQLKKTVTNDRSQPIISTKNSIQSERRNSRPQTEISSPSNHTTPVNPNNAPNFLSGIMNGVSNLKPISPHQSSTVPKSTPNIAKFNKPAPNTYINNKTQAPPPPPSAGTKPSLHQQNNSSPVLRPSIPFSHPSNYSSSTNGGSKPKPTTHKQTPAPPPPLPSSKPNSSPRPPPPIPPARPKSQYSDTSCPGVSNQNSPLPPSLKWSNSSSATTRDSSASTVDGRSPRFSAVHSPSRPVSQIGAPLSNRPLPPPPPPSAKVTPFASQNARSSTSQSIQDIWNQSQAAIRGPATPYRDKNTKLPGNQMPWKTRTISTESDDPPPPPPSRKLLPMSTSCYNLSQPPSSPAPPVPPKRPPSGAPPPSPSRLSMGSGRSQGSVEGIGGGQMKYDTMLEEKFLNFFHPDALFSPPPPHANVCIYYPSQVREIPLSGPPALPQRK